MLSPMNPKLSFFSFPYPYQHGAIGSSSWMISGLRSWGGALDFQIDCLCHRELYDKGFTKPSLAWPSEAELPLYTILESTPKTQHNDYTSQSQSFPSLRSPAILSSLSCWAAKWNLSNLPSGRPRIESSLWSRAL